MTLYETLGVTKESSSDEIKQAFKKLAKKYHPDVNPNNSSAEAKFKEISTAYNVLSDSQKRTAYDRELDGWQNPFGDLGEFIFNPFEIFNSASHIITKIKIAFLDAKSDHVKTVKFTRKGLCKICNGSGAKTFSGNCDNCHGKGVIRSGLGFISALHMCNVCNGKGKQIKEKCLTCQQGLVSESIDANINIPAGITNGKVLKVTGEGNRFFNGSGDLLIRVEIDDDPRWERQGADVFSKVVIDYPTLILGGEIEIETIWGKEKLNIVAGSKINNMVPLYNKGFPRLNGLLPTERGTHNIIFELLIPALSDGQKHRELLLELKKLYIKQ